MYRRPSALPLLALLLAAGVTGCPKAPPATAPAAAPARHQHHPPHGGTPVVLGEELGHLELVRDAATGRLSAYVLDGEMESFLRIAAPSLEITVMLAGQPRTLVLAAIPNPATGENRWQHFPVRGPGRLAQDRADLRRGAHPDRGSRHDLHRRRLQFSNG